MRVTVSAVALFATAIFVGPAGAQQAPAFDWSGAVAQGKTIEVLGVNGDIDAALSDDGRVHVHATRTGRRSNPESVRIEVVEHGDGVTICAVYPTPDDADDENECEPGGGNMSVNNNDVEVHFTVRVPAGVRLAAATVNGAVEAQGLRSDVEASTVNGDVTVATSGLAEASTVNGDIAARVGSGTLARDLEFSTVNGSIELSAPAGLNADLDASTVNGEIDSDFEVRVRGSMDRQSLRGTIGSGGEDLDLSTVNGRIRLRRISPAGRGPRRRPGRTRAPPRGRPGPA